MEIKTFQWNIGGGRICLDGADPTVPRSYAEERLDVIIEIIKREDPDIITLQETHEVSNYSHPEIIATSIGYEFWLNHPTDQSFIDESMHIGQSVISRYPMTECKFTPFKNPRFEILKEGEQVRSRNGGLTTCTVDKGPELTIRIATFHIIPFHFFDVDIDSDMARTVLYEVENCLLDEVGRHSIVQGDFNIDSPLVLSYFPNLVKAGYTEFTQVDPTTPSGKRLDHVVFDGLVLETVDLIRDSGTDHFPIKAVFTQIPHGGSLRRPFQSTNLSVFD